MNGARVMGAMVAVVDKRGGNVVPATIAMLRSLKHRGTDAHGVATQDSVEIVHSFEDLEDIDLNSNMAIGYNLSRVTSNDMAQPVLGNGRAFVFNGRFFPEETCKDRVTSRFQGNLEKKTRHILGEHDGAYAFAVSGSDKIVAGRDANGLIPLYYGEDFNICSLASERKALWTLGIRNAKPFPPGNIATINAQGFVFEKVASIIQPKLRAISLKAAAKHLRLLLLKSTTERVRDVEQIAIAFSGGLDSAIIGLLAKMSGVQVQLIFVGLESQQEQEHVERASSALELPIHIQTYNVSDVEKAVSKVLWLVEEPNQMKVGVAIPFFWTAEIASRIGCTVLLAGQGSDELFGGYKRYLSELDQKGMQALRKVLHHDIVSSHETNFQRDHPVCAFHKVELRLPFIDREVINFALSLPLKLKIDSVEDLLRKKVLRRVAENMEMPSFITNRAKKAVQYSTGVNKALKKLAKSQDLTVSDYLNKLFYETFPDLEALS